MYSLSPGSTKRPTVYQFKENHGWWKWNTQKALKDLLRFTDLKPLVAEVKKYRLKVEIKGKIYPFHTINLGTVARDSENDPLRFKSISKRHRVLESTHNCFVLAWINLVFALFVLQDSKH